MQDQHSPSAQDHSRQPTHPAPLGIGAAAPHQAAAVRHVAQERSSEEHQAAETWNETTILRQDPPSDDDDDDNDNIHDGHDDVAKDERNLQRDELAVRQNGGMSGSDDPDMADAEVDDGLEDDNMDRISSSPSIDDGGFFFSSNSYLLSAGHISAHPRRILHGKCRSSLFKSVPLSPEPGDGKPFTRDFEQNSVYNVSVSSTVSSLYCSTPLHLPLCTASETADDVALDHHPSGEYLDISTDFGLVDPLRTFSTEYFLDTPASPGNHGESYRAFSSINQDQQYSEAECGTLKEQAFQHNSLSYSDLANEHHEHIFLSRDISNLSFSVDDVLGAFLPEHDPFLDDSFEDTSCSDTNSYAADAWAQKYTYTQLANSTEDLTFPSSGSSSSSSSSWCTRSNLDGSKWDDDSDNDDDDFHTCDISFDNKLFCDLGRESVCLREVEDIDFDFVYALHTFQAVVDGQANATKGDTMVLLDDSNSYWWLVRIVKDGTIGSYFEEVCGHYEYGLTWHQVIFLLSILKRQQND